MVFEVHPDCSIFRRLTVEQVQFTIGISRAWRVSQERIATNRFTPESANLEIPEFTAGDDSSGAFIETVVGWIVAQEFGISTQLEFGKIRIAANCRRKNPEIGIVSDNHCDIPHGSGSGERGKTISGKDKLK